MDHKLKYVARERMASGKMRYRFQRYGQKKTIKGEYGSPEFLAHYAALLDGIDWTPENPITKGSIQWLVGKFLHDLERRVQAGLASPLTLKGHRHHLGRYVEEYGEYDLRIPRGKLASFLDEFSDRPGARDNLRKSISALYEWAIDREYHDGENPAKRIKRINTKSKGFYTCTYADIQKYLKFHGTGTMARRAMIMVLFTAARREDLRLLGPFNRFTRDGRPWLRWTQTKAPGREVEIPMHPMLAAELVDVKEGTFLHNKNGRPMTHGTLGNYVQQWFKDAGVRGSLHPVRKGLSSILAEMGATSYQIDVLLGHELGSDQSNVYIEEANRGRIADSLYEKMEQIRI